MALLRGKLFAGALFAGALFGAPDAPDAHAEIHRYGVAVGAEARHHATHGSKSKARTLAKHGANATTDTPLKQEPDIQHGTAASSNTSSAVALGSVPDSNLAVGNVAVRIPRHEQRLAGRLPAALGASITARDAIQYAALNEAMMQYAARQAADEDDEMAIIAIMMTRVI